MDLASSQAGWLAGYTARNNHPRADIYSEGRMDGYSLIMYVTAVVWTESSR